MGYKWRPSASQRRAFAERMKDPEEQAAYEQGKRERAEKRRATSQFDYEKAGGRFVPTKEQYIFCFENMHLADTSEKQTAFNDIIYGWSCQEKVHHDHIHIVNEERRKQCQSL